MSLRSHAIQNTRPRFLSRDCTHPPPHFGALRLACFFSLPHFGVARRLPNGTFMRFGRAFGHNILCGSEQIEPGGV